MMYLLKRQTIRLLEVEADLFAAKKMNEQERIGYVESLLTVSKICVSATTTISPFPCSFSDTSALEQRCNTLLQFSWSKRRKCREGVKIMGIVLTTLFVMVLSFTYIFEPYYDSPLDLEGSFAPTRENAFVVKNQNNGYDMYFENQYYATFLEFHEALEQLNQYESLEEAYLYEKK